MKDHPSEFTEKDLVTLVREFGRPVPSGFKEGIIAKIRAREMEKARKTEPSRPSRQRSRTPDRSPEME